MSGETFLVGLQTTIHIFDLERMKVTRLLGTGGMDVGMQSQISEK
jgi:hypothetical protein